jgi:lysophospholipase L1-like esterase
LNRLIKSNKSGILTVFWGIITLFFLLEVTLRIPFFWQKYPIYQYKVQEKKVHCFDEILNAILLCPNVDEMIRHPHGFHFELSTNSNGERITADESKEDRLKQKSIWAIGDSLTMGWGISDKESFPYLLSKDDWIVRNLASDSLGSIDIKNILQYKIKFTTSYDLNLPLKIVWMFSRSDFVDDTSQKSNRFKFWLGKNIYSLVAIRSLLEANKYAKDRNDYKDDLLEKFEEPDNNHPTLLALQEISALSKKYKIPILIILTPDWKYTNGPPNYNSAYLHYMDQFFRSHGFQVLNLTEKYKEALNQDFYLLDDGHPNAKAHRLIAKELNATLIKFK